MAPIDMKDVVSTVNGNFVLYKNRPLVREDSVICYGNVSDKYILKMTVMTEKEYKGRAVPDKIYIELLSTDQTLPESSRVVKSAMKSGFCEAFEIGITWLERYLAS